MSLFVGRLPSDFSERDLEDIFYKYGKISRCDLKRGASFCKYYFIAVYVCFFLLNTSVIAFGFVEFEDQEDAHDAMRDTDGMVRTECFLYSTVN
jgi:RNA recognition motif-containing protein